MFKYSRVTLDRSETTKLTLDMAPWEVAVMAAANGNSHVAVIGETPVNRQLPDPAAEYDRLAAKYKFEGDGGRTYVSLVYGEGDRGIAELAKEIDKARAVARAAPIKTPEYDAGDDPLKGLYDDASVIDGEAVELTE
jgi:hypothetical protein